MKFMKPFIFPSTALYLALVVSGCAMFGGGDEMEEASEDGELTGNLADALDGESNNYGYGDNEEYGNENNYYGDNNEPIYTDEDGESYNADSEGYDDVNNMASMDSSSGGEYTASAPLSGNVFFVQMDTQVVSSPEGGEALFTLVQGDTIKGEPVGDYTMIGAGQYVMSSALTQSIVSRMPAANPWR